MKNKWWKRNWSERVERKWKIYGMINKCGNVDSVERRRERRIEEERRRDRKRRESPWWGLFLERSDCGLLREWTKVPLVISWLEVENEGTNEILATEVRYGRKQTEGYDGKARKTKLVNLKKVKKRSYRGRKMWGREVQKGECGLVRINCFPLAIYKWF